MQIVGLEGLECLEKYRFCDGSGVVFGDFLVPKMLEKHENAVPEPSGVLLGASWDPLG